jgi:hypothetical protein
VQVAAAGDGDDDDDTAPAAGGSAKVDAKLGADGSTDAGTVAREEQAIKLDGLSVAETKALSEKAEKHQFQAEVNRMMKLIINSLYRNKEVRPPTRMWFSSPALFGERGRWCWLLLVVWLVVFVVGFCLLLWKAWGPKARALLNESLVL